MMRSSRPGRVRAGSRTDGRLVAPMTKTSGLFLTGPRSMPNQRRILCRQRSSTWSESESIWLSRVLRPVPPPIIIPPIIIPPWPPWPPRFMPIESISSMNMMQAPRWPGDAYFRPRPRASRKSFMTMSSVMPQNMPRSELASM